VKRLIIIPAIILAPLAIILSRPAHAQTVTPQPTRKLCQPSGTVVGYTTACPSGTTSVQKICPYGQIVAYSTACPTSPPPAPPPPPPPPAPSPLAYGGKATAQLACQSQQYSPDYTTVVGASYTVVGFAHYIARGTPDLMNTARDVVVLNDSAHKGDGAFGIWVPVNCVVGQ
jgi:hypothetical protein